MKGQLLIHLEFSRGSALPPGYHCTKLHLRCDVIEKFLVLPGALVSWWHFFDFILVPQFLTK